MEQTSSYGKKLLRNILTTTIVGFTVTMFFVVNYSYQSSQEDAVKYAQQLAGKYSAQIQNDINQAIVVARTLTSKFELAAVYKLQLDKHESIAYMESILKHNKNIVGVWWTFKNPDQVFPIDLNGSDKNAYDKDGQFHPYVVRVNGGFKYQPGSPYNEKDGWIGGPKKAGKPYITKPYIYPVDGKDVLLTSICIPMYKDGKFIGAAGVDFNSQTFAQMASDIKIYKSGYSFIVDDFGVVIGHPNQDFLGKNLLEITDNDGDYKTLLNNTKHGKEYTFIEKSSNSSLYSYPFSIKGADVNWSFVLSVPIEEYLANAIFIRNLSIIASIIGIILVGVVMLISIRRLNSYIALISSGLEDFFRFLNEKESTSSIKEIQISTNCEFGVMAYTINENISKIKQSINEDNALIEEVKEVVGVVSKRKFDKRITSHTTTKSLNELKELLNHMLDKLEKQVGKDMNLILQTLQSYTKRDFAFRLDENSGLIGQEIIKMNRMVTKMLQGSQKDGFTLQESANQLTSNMQTLSGNAISQASSLEETAASVEEITSNIEQTNKKAKQMNAISDETKNSALKGKELANDTVKSMDNINETVNNINEAISVIDQIAFQTNILSLNAAVEAATAGEAGKGFAVVAGEVRNLASRSAEAAKDIKDLVEVATQKANTGKNISSSMIEGFTKLEEKIVQTSSLIEDVTTAANEQTLGMRQISDAMGLLDKFTQENASIADETNTIAKKTNQIAQVVVENVNKNNFDGKKV